MKTIIMDHVIDSQFELQSLNEALFSCLRQLPIESIV